MSAVICQMGLILPVEVSTEMQVPALLSALCEQLWLHYHSESNQSHVSKEFIFTNGFFHYILLTCILCNNNMPFFKNVDFIIIKIIKLFKINLFRSIHGLYHLILSEEKIFWQWKLVCFGTFNSVLITLR